MRGDRRARGGTERWPLRCEGALQGTFVACVAALHAARGDTRDEAWSRDGCTAVYRAHAALGARLWPHHERFCADFAPPRTQMTGLTPRNSLCGRQTLPSSGSSLFSFFPFLFSRSHTIGNLPRIGDPPSRADTAPLLGTYRRARLLSFEHHRRHAAQRGCRRRC